MHHFLTLVALLHFFFSSVTSFREAEAADESLIDGAQTTERANTKGQEPRGPGLHQRVNDDNELIFFRRMEKGQSAASTQKRFKFLERFTRTAPAPPHGCPKLIPTERSATGHHVREMLTDLFRSCSCSRSNSNSSV